MKKKVIISIIAFSLIIGGTVLTNAKPKSNLAKMWGNVLSKDYEKKESKKNNEYRISLYGKISEKTEEINDIAEEGKDILIETDEIDKAEEFYKIKGNDEEVAKEKAKSYVEGQNALYIEAIKKGYDVTDKELDQYIAELKETVSTAENREVAQDIIDSFDSEEDYWKYERELYKKLLPIQKYVKKLENDFIKQNLKNKTDEQVKNEWTEELEKIKAKAVKNQNFQELQHDEKIDSKFIK